MNWFEKKGFTFPSGDFRWNKYGEKQDIRIGDVVKVHKPKQDSAGIYWVPDMDGAEGKTFTVLADFKFYNKKEDKSCVLLSDRQTSSLGYNKCWLELMDRPSCKTFCDMCGKRKPTIGKPGICDSCFTPRQYNKPVFFTSCVPNVPKGNINDWIQSLEETKAKRVEVEKAIEKTIEKVSLTVNEITVCSVPGDIVSPPVSVDKKVGKIGARCNACGSDYIGLHACIKKKDSKPCKICQVKESVFDSLCNDCKDLEYCNYCRKDDKESCDPSPCSKCEKAYSAGHSEGYSEGREDFEQELYENKEITFRTGPSETGKEVILLSIGDQIWEYTTAEAGQILDDLYSVLKTIKEMPSQPYEEDKFEFVCEKSNTMHWTLVSDGGDKVEIPYGALLRFERLKDKFFMFYEYHSFRSSDPMNPMKLEYVWRKHLYGDV